MAGNSVVRARIDERTKREAAAALKKVGLTVSDAFRLLLVRIAVEKALPFEPLNPNAATVAAMKAARRGELVKVGKPDKLLRVLGDGSAVLRFSAVRPGRRLVSANAVPGHLQPGGTSMRRRLLVNLDCRGLACIHIPVSLCNIPAASMLPAHPSRMFVIEASNSRMTTRFGCGDANWLSIP